jgi:hypothetical protein
MVAPNGSASLLPYLSTFVAKDVFPNNVEIADQKSARAILHKME